MTPARRSSGTRTRLPAAVLSVVFHLAVLAVLIGSQSPGPPKPADPEPMVVALVEPPPPPPPQPPTPPAPTPAAAKPAPPTPPPRRTLGRPAPPTRDVIPIPAAPGPTSDSASEVSEAELAGAGTAETGGGACNMARWLQARLRKDSQVQAAMAEAGGGRAIRVWNGDWIRRAGQEGEGLAAVREAIMWEVAFAPAACRAESVHGLILISLNDAPGSARLAVGAGAWRWSDLLFSRSTAGRARP